MRMAMLSDVHSNLPALEAFPIVMGNNDDGTALDRDEGGCACDDPVEKGLGGESFAWTRAHVSDENRAWLQTLHPQEPTMRLRPFVEIARRTARPATDRATTR